MKPNPEKVAARSQKRNAAKRVADRYAVTEHATPEAREKHLKKYPNANPSDHVVKEESGSEGGRSRMRRKPTQRPETGKERARRRQEYLDRRKKKRETPQERKKRQETELKRTERPQDRKRRKEERRLRYAPPRPKQGTVFQTQEALDNHIQSLQPKNREKARKKHTVKEKKNDSGSADSGSGGGSSSIKLPAGTKPSKSIQKALENEKGRETVSNITNKEKSKSFAKRIREAASPKKIIKTLAESAVREIRNVVQNTPTILMDCIKEKRKPSSEKQKWPKGCDKPGSKTKCSVGEASERDILYGSAVYAAGVAVTVLGSTENAVDTTVLGSKAFLNSLTLHIGIGAVSSKMDTNFLHWESGETAATLAGGETAKAVSTYGSGTLDGLGSLFENAFNFARSMLASEDFDSILQDQELIRVANEGDAGKTYEKFVQGVIDYAVAKLEKGLSDEEIKTILEYEA